jgi:hypothetical protein
MIPSRPGEYGRSAAGTFGAGVAAAVPSASADGAAAGAPDREVAVSSMLLVVIVAFLRGWVRERLSCRRSLQLASADRTCSAGILPRSRLLALVASKSV